ncbi:MAG: glycerophosphodiester phosphodiesterase family protein [Bacteroidota bacterium]
MYNRIRTFLLIACLSIAYQSASQDVPTSKDTELPEDASKIKQLISKLEDAQSDEIIVVAHRGDWRNAPENSLPAIQNCIDLSVDMVEIDVRMTSDSVLVLMHDETIDRTTTGIGKVREVSWDYLQDLQLRDGIGHATPHKIPTLEEALRLAKGEILVNLDKSYPIFDLCYDVIKKTGTSHQVIIKGAKRLSEVQNEFGEYLSEVYFMPLVRLANPEARSIVEEYLETDIPVAFEFTVPQDTLSMISEFDDIRLRGSSVWVNSLWPQHNGGHDDEKAVTNPEVYDWFIQNHINIIQTDRPALLLSYLRAKDLHN